MRAGSRSFVTTLTALTALTALGCGEAEAPLDTSGLGCVHVAGAARTDCAAAARAQRAQRPALSDPADLVIQRATARREGGSLVVGVELAGPFRSEIDQNLYLLAGAAGSPPSTYRITADEGYLDDVGYPVRGQIDLPHGNDVRVGVMAPAVSAYTPQVYLEDPVYAHAVGADTGVTTEVEGRSLTVRVPLDRYYQARRLPTPARWSVTVATARDYVGFVDQASVLDVEDGASQWRAPRQIEPASYPALDLESHALKGASVEERGGRTEIALETAAPIADWAQTNLHFFLLPVPVYKAAFALPDPSKTQNLPCKWSYYCGVYSPGRVFCKASRGSDFRFDDGYAAREELDPPDGVSFRAEPGRYVLSLEPHAAKAARAGRAAFAVVASIGRDGFPPTTWFGLPPP